MRRTTVRSWITAVFTTTWHWLLMGYVLFFSVGFTYSWGCLPFQFLSHNWYNHHLTYGSGHPVFWMTILYLIVGACIMIALAHRHNHKPGTGPLMIYGLLLPVMAPIAVLLPPGRRWMQQHLAPH